MYKIEKCYDKTQLIPQEFKTLKDAVFYCDKYLDEDFQILKIVKGKIVDIYNLIQRAYVLTAHSSSTGRIYTYFK